MKFTPEEIIELISEFAENEGIQVEMVLKEAETVTDGLADCVVKPVSYVLHTLPIAKILALIKALESVIDRFDFLDLEALKAIILTNPELRKQIHLTVLDYLKSLEMKPVETKK